MTYDFFDVRVVRREFLNPSAVRVVLGGDFAGVVSGGRDQRFKLFLPQTGQDEPDITRGEDWYLRWRLADPAVRGIMRTYTIRAHRGDEIDVDFAIHEPAGPASRWAQQARPGDRAVILAPTVVANGGVDFQPPEGTDWVLLTGDETALPALAGILAWVGTSMPVRAWISVTEASAVPAWTPPATAQVHWLVGADVTDALRAADLPAGTAYAWVSGESSVVRETRRHLVGERGFDRRRVTFTGYWRRGVTEDDLIEVAAAEA